MQISFIDRQHQRSVPVTYDPAIYDLGESALLKFIKTVFILIFLFSSLLSCSMQKDKWDPIKLEIPPEDSVLESSDKVLPDAIRVLILRADRHIDQKQWPKAIAVLERALRINKRQAETWARMALAYQGKNELEQAIQMAKRSNSYAAQKTDLKIYNWQLISNAYLKLGKLDLSQSAAQKSQQLSADK